MGGGRIYNLGNGQGFTVLEVIETARQITGHPIPAEIGVQRPGGPTDFGGRKRQDPRRIRLAAKIPRFTRNCRKRVELAPTASPWLRQIRI